MSSQNYWENYFSYSQNMTNPTKVPPRLNLDNRPEPTIKKAHVTRVSVPMTDFKVPVGTSLYDYYLDLLGFK